MKNVNAVGRLKRTLRQVAAKWQLRRVDSSRDEGKAICLMFHTIFRTREEMEASGTMPWSGILEADFRASLEAISDLGYRFLRPGAIPAEGESGVMITFDDGYYNNRHALPVVKEFGAAAAFFIATDFCEHATLYPWDTIYATSVAQGQSLSDVRRRLQEMKHKGGKSPFSYAAALATNVAPTDLNRSFTLDELRDFSREAGVVIGNHTASHALLDLLEPSAVRDQLDRAQRTLGDICGKPPDLLAYPNGNYSDEVVEVARDLGFAGAFTIKRQRIAVGSRLRQGRYSLTSHYPLYPQLLRMLMH